jgi:hypothetical protein
MHKFSNIFRLWMKKVKEISIYISKSMFRIPHGEDVLDDEAGNYPNSLTQKKKKKVI